MKTVIAGWFILIMVMGNAWGTVANSPQELVKDTSERMLEALRDHREELDRDPGLIYDLVEDIALPHFDFELMSRWVLGRYWRETTPEQRSRFVEEFHTLLVRSYATALLEYSDEEIHYPPMRAPAEEEDVTVRTEIQRSGRPSIPVNYSMRLTDDGWKVYDVIIEGVSLVTTYRGEFAAQIRTEGMDALIETLRERNQQVGQ